MEICRSKHTSKEARNPTRNSELKQFIMNERTIKGSKLSELEMKIN